MSVFFFSPDSVLIVNQQLTLKGRIYEHVSSAYCQRMKPWWNTKLVLVIWSFCHSVSLDVYELSSWNLGDAKFYSLQEYQHCSKTSKPARRRKKKNWEQVLQACFVIDCKKARGHWHVNLYRVTLLRNIEACLKNDETSTCRIRKI